MLNNGKTSNGGAVKSRRAVLKATGGIFGVGSLTGCIGNSGQSGSGLGTVKVGSPTGLSGSHSGPGVRAQNGVDLGIKYVNESDDYDFTMEGIHEDTQLKPAVASQKAEKLVLEDEVDLLVGGASTSACLAVSDIAKQRSVPYITTAGSEIATSKRCHNYLFRLLSHSGQTATALASYILNNLGTKIWFHIADYAYGESVLNSMTRELNNVGTEFEIVGETRSELGNTDFGSYITQISDSDAEVVILGMIGANQVQFLKQASRQGLNDEKHLTAQTGTFLSHRKPAGEAAANVIGAARYSPQLETGDNQQFVRAYQEEYDEPPSNLARGAYDSVRAAAQGLQASGSSNPNDIVKAMSGMTAKTAFGEVKIRECDHQAVNPVWVARNVMVEGSSYPKKELLTKIEPEKALRACSQIDCSLK